MSSCKMERVHNSTTTGGYRKKENPAKEWGVGIDIPDRFRGPISLSIMIDPVVASDGTTYEYDSLVEYALPCIDAAHLISPTTREILKTTVYENLVLRGEIYAFVEKHGGELRKAPPKGFQIPTLVGKVHEQGDNVIMSEVSEITSNEISEQDRVEQYWAYTTASTIHQRDRLYIQKIYPVSDATAVWIPVRESMDFLYGDSRKGIPIISSIQWDKKALYLYVGVYCNDATYGGIYIYDCKGDLMDFYRLAFVNSISCVHVLRDGDNPVCKLLVHTGNQRRDDHTMNTFMWYAGSNIERFSLDDEVIPSVEFDPRVTGTHIINSKLVCDAKYGVPSEYNIPTDGNVDIHTRRHISGRDIFHGPISTTQCAGMMAFMDNHIKHSPEVVIFMYDSTRRICGFQLNPILQQFGMIQHGISVRIASSSSTLYIYITSGGSMCETQFIYNPVG
jgi:hypothetical protein